jgi:hypothetical protein
MQVNSLAWIEKKEDSPVMICNRNQINNILAVCNTTMRPVRGIYFVKLLMLDHLALST